MGNMLDLEYAKLFDEFKKKEKEFSSTYKSGGSELTEKYKEMHKAWEKVDEIIQKMIKE